MTASYEFDSDVEDDFVVRAYSAGNVEFSTIDSDVITLMKKSILKYGLKNYEKDYYDYRSREESFFQAYSASGTGYSYLKAQAVPG